MFHSIQKFLNQGKAPIMTDQKTTKEMFLSEHNKLSPLEMQATTSLLSRFRVEKAAIFKDNDWPVDKIRRPFILWLTSLSIKEKKDINKNQKA